MNTFIQDMRSPNWHTFWSARTKSRCRIAMGGSWARSRRTPSAMRLPREDDRAIGDEA